LQRDQRAAALVGGFLADIPRIPGRFGVIFRPWGFRRNDIRSQPIR